MELEYESDLDEHYVIIPESVLARLGWEEGDMLDFDIEEEVIRIYRI